MRAVVQRASSAEVVVENEVVGRLERPGLVVLLGVTHTDTAESADRLARKIWELRILEGERAASDEGAPLLVISQFTLYADLSKGRRPSWSAAAPGPVSEPLYDAFCGALRGLQFTFSGGKDTGRTAMKAFAAVYMESSTANGAARRLAAS